MVLEKSTKVHSLPSLGEGKKNKNANKRAIADDIVINVDVVGKKYKSAFSLFSGRGGSFNLELSVKRQKRVLCK